MLMINISLCLSEAGLFFIVAESGVCMWRLRKPACMLYIIFVRQIDEINWKKKVIYLLFVYACSILQQLYLILYGIICSNVWSIRLISLPHLLQFFVALFPLLSSQCSYDEASCHISSLSSPLTSSSLPFSFPTAKTVTGGWGCWQEVFCQVLWESQLHCVPVTITRVPHPSPTPTPSPFISPSPSVGDKIQYHGQKNYLIRESEPLLKETTVMQQFTAVAIITAVLCKCQSSTQLINH